MVLSSTLCTASGVYNDAILRHHSQIREQNKVCMRLYRLSHVVLTCHNTAPCTTAPRMLQDNQGQQMGTWGLCGRREAKSDDTRQGTVAG